MEFHEKDTIYLDNNATTKVIPEVFESMVPYLTEYYGNPSSAYGFGRQIKDGIDKAREQVSELLGCETRELFFTSCGTESDNAAIWSALQITGGKHVITSSVEHSAIKNQCEFLEKLGYGVTWLPVGKDGTLKVEDVENALREDTAVVSLMWANNETGVTFPIEEVAELCRSRKIFFHTDAVQAVGKIPFKLSDMKVDFLSLSGHKLNAPKGVGALYIRRRAKFVPYVMGGHQEKGKRGGTENVASIVGLGTAAEIAGQHVASEQESVRALRDYFEKSVLESIPNTRVNGHLELRLPNTSNIAFCDFEAEAILMELDRFGICASAGSACTTGSLQPSHVLTAMGVPAADAMGSIRFSFSRFNTQEEVDKTLSVLKDAVAKLKNAQPVAS